MKSIKQLMNIKGRVAVVTGGAGFLGFVMAETLAEMGAHIVLVDVNRSACNAKAKRLVRKYKADAFPLVVDLSVEEEVRSISSAVAKKFGRLDILVTTAALSGISDLEGWTVAFEKQSADTWRKALEINLTSIFVLIQSCSKMLIKSKHGSIINVSSIYGTVGPDMQLYEGTDMGNPAAYGASKGGVLQLTRYLSTVLAPKVRVNAISPGGVSRSQDKTFVSRYIKRTPLGRMAKQEDLKGAVAYLASDLSAYVTGQNIIVDGGWTAW